MNAAQNLEFISDDGSDPDAVIPYALANYTTEQKILDVIQEHGGAASRSLVLAFFRDDEADDARRAIDALEMSGRIMLDGARYRKGAE